VIRLKENGMTWTLFPEFASVLAQLHSDAGQIIKQTPTKVVSRHAIAGRTYYRKRYLNTVGLRPLKYFFKKSEARCEWDLAQAYERAQIPVVRHCAMGERWTPVGLTESVLITEGCAGQPLSRSGVDQVPAVQVAVAKLIRQMHAAGLVQADLHHNIMVRQDPLELWRIDVDRTQCRPLTESDRLENLAYLNIFVPLSDAFWAAYGADVSFVARAQQRTAARRRSLAARRSRRCLETNSRFQRVQLGGLDWWVRTDALNDPLRHLLADPDGALARSDRLFKSGPHRQAIVGAISGFVLKRFQQKNRANYLKDIFRPSRAFRAYRKGYHLELLDLATPKIIAAAERRCCRVVGHSYLVTEEIPGARHLRETPHVAIAVAAAAGRLIGRLHAHGFSHTDLKETNLIWDAAGQVYLLDLDSLVFWKQLPEQRALADLRRLATGTAQLSDAHRQAFLQAYCEVRGLTQPPRC
jgi:tRNA A-37 threonylcarbamoyl transferase component Bud32